LVVTSDTQHRFILGGAGRRSSFCAIFLQGRHEETRGRFALDPSIDILEGMAGNLFDVFVVGSTDPSAAGETRLAAALSAKHGLPLATVAKAISAKNLRAGQSLDQAQAQALVRHLQSIGAVTVIRPAMRPPGQGGQGGQPSQIASAPVAQPSPMPATSPNRLKPPTPPPGSGWPGAGPSLGSTPSPVAGATVFGTPSSHPSSPSSVDPFAPLAPAQPRVQPGAPDPFQPKHVPTPSISGRAAAKMPTPSPVLSPPSASGLALDRAPAPKLELARNELSTSSELPAIPPARTSTSELSLREIGMKAKSGVAVDEDPKNLNLVRCVQHGLYYDKSKASGCRKCMASAREAVNKMEAAQVTNFRLGDFRRKPAQRAFLGLGFALVLGFMPAVYYCFGPGTAEVRKLRVEQELLSRQPGTEEIMHHFDELDAQVNDSHHQATRNTAIVWVAVSSMAMLGWYRIT
jgi:hypothetical protein